MKLILAAKWPALKPLPVFKYETKEYRASIEFDKTHGEWLCRKTSFASNNVQELRGALAELTLALPHDQTAVRAESAAADQPEPEFDKEANRRVQAILEWRQNYRNGAAYSELRDYLSESQQHEIDDCIRLSLTARQLQFNPKNIAYIFDALSKAGGRLATLIGIALRNKAEREANPAAQASFPPESPRSFAPEPTDTLIPALAEASTPGPVQSLIPATFDKSPEQLIERVFTVQQPASPPEPILPAASQASPIATPDTPHVRYESLIEALGERPRRHSSVAPLRRPVPTARVESPEDRTAHWYSRFHVPEISGFQLPALAVAILFAVVSLTVGLTMRRSTPAKHPPDAQNSKPNVATESPASPDRPNQSSSSTPTPPPSNTLVAPSAPPPSFELQDASPSAEKSTESTPVTASAERVPAISNPSPSSSAHLIESKPSANSQASPWPDASTGLIVRNDPPPATDKPPHMPKSVGLLRRAPRNLAPRSVQPAAFAAPHFSRPAALLVTPAYGAKPFRVSFPEKTVSANSSFAMTSQLSVLVSPQHGPGAAHMSARLQSAELLSFVWPRYPKSGDPYALAELIKVRATIGRLGRVTVIKFVGGSSSMLPATASAIRQWRYRPTLLNKKPVPAEQDITIEFRPSQYLSHLTTQRLSPN
jgi:hypothetical protein